MTALHAIRDRFLAQVEQAAQELEQQISGPALDSLAYQQGQRDERARILAHLQSWRDSIPCVRALEPTRNALATIITTLQR
jgi:hypothetical protein